MCRADNMAKTYDIAAIESSMYKNWEEKGYLKGVIDHNKSRIRNELTRRRNSTT